MVAVPSVQSELDEFLIADYVIHSFLDFQPERWGLPPFNDCTFPDKCHHPMSLFNGTKRMLQLEVTL